MTQRRAIRTFEAPTRPEAEAMAVPVISAFGAAGWTEQERLWIPGDRRIGLGESLLLDHQDQVLIEATGTLRIAWITEDESLPEPADTAAPRDPDPWEEIGGTRYRRLVPRWIIGIAVFVIGALILLSWAGSMRPGGVGGSSTGLGDPPSFSGFGPGLDGTCPEGYGLEVDGENRICWPDDYFTFFDKTPVQPGSAP